MVFSIRLSAFEELDVISPSMDASVIRKQEAQGHLSEHIRVRKGTHPSQ